ncbi:MAG: aminopeptidase P family protein [Planctomycetes bacterium]|nr:aminopeptidase P family protein [Planctomycetota bacterium]
MSEHPKRRERLIQQIVSEGIDAVLVSNPVNVTYLTGFTGDSSHLVVSAAKTVLISDGRFTEQLAEECPGLECHIRPPSQPVIEASAQVLGSLGVAKVGVESGHLTIANFESLKEKLRTVAWKLGGDRVERLRQTKDDGEVAAIRRAIRVAQTAFTMFRAMLRPADTEKELADSLEMYTRRAGGDEGAFPSIVAVGARAALPHAPPTPRRVSEASLTLIDWGASAGGYKSDLTRVLFPHNNAGILGANGVVPSKLVEPKLREVYAVVLRAQLKAIAAIRPGVKTGAVDAAARGVIEEAGYGDYFTHSTGHGIGLQIHEAPFLRAGFEQLLEPGMVVTVEPGIYLPGVAGIRIEDDVLVTPNGSEVLTSVPKDLETCIHEF